MRTAGRPRTHHEGVSAGLGPGWASRGRPGGELGAGRARAARRAGGGEGQAVPTRPSSGRVAASLPPSGTGPVAGSPSGREKPAVPPLAPFGLSRSCPRGSRAVTIVAPPERGFSAPSPALEGAGRGGSSCSGGSRLAGSGNLHSGWGCWPGCRPSLVLVWR